jgi:uncharacterized protein (UPF0332 family)
MEQQLVRGAAPSSENRARRNHPVTKSRDDLAHYRMARAYETLQDARVLADKQRWNACVNRLYYACFYAVSALLAQDDLSSSRHTGVRSLFNRQYVKTGKVPKQMARVYNDLFERRQESDYIDFVSFQEAQVLPWIPKARELVDYIAGLVKR